MASHFHSSAKKEKNYWGGFEWKTWNVQSDGETFLADGSTFLPEEDVAILKQECSHSGKADLDELLWAGSLSSLVYFSWPKIYLCLL